MKIKLKQLALAASFASAFSAAPSFGQTPKTEYDPGDLILGFQVDGGTSILEVNIGASIQYRDRTTDLLNIINLAPQLTTLAGFGGSAWFNNTNLYFGIAGMRSGTNANDSGTNTGAVGVNDPNRTFYFTKSRLGLGTVGLSNSGSFTATGANAGTNFPVYANAFDTREVLGIYAGPTTTNGWEDSNPIVAGVQGTAFSGSVPAGIQQAFGSGSFGNFGAAGAVEGALDLWRDSAFVNAGVPEFLPVGSETYQGSFVIDSDGDLSFIAVVPEPSSAMLLGSTALLGGFLRRRRNS